MNKSELRTELLKRRKFECSNEKEISDSSIIGAFLNSEIYRNAASLLIYISFGSEIETKGIINRAFADNKTVAVPYCSDNEMNFYEIVSGEKLVEGAYGIMTVSTHGKEPFIPDENALCIVPGLGFDCDGNRIGYGGGYYDRYLEKYTVKTAALCYNKCLEEQIPVDSHDIKIDYIFTEDRFINARR